MEELLRIYKSSTGVVIDSRNVEEGNLFIALKGGNVDGNEYAASALEKGAIAAVIDDQKYQADEKTILVDDALMSLQHLATAYRDELKIPVFALTGSNGKTTTKELIHAVLNKKFNAFATKGNLNNHIGVPLSILSIKEEHEIAVIEMGANHLKEIEFLCGIAKPTHGLITNIGLAHLEGFGSPEGVKKAKSELFRYLMQKGGILFVNSSEEKLKDIYAGYQNIFTYGTNGDEYLHGTTFSGHTFARVAIDDMQIISNLVGSYNASNILAAACVGKYFEIPEMEIKDAIERYVPTNNRSELRKIGDNYFILDAYNANPSSMTAALENFKFLDVKNKIAILGDMLELGSYASAQHKIIADLAIAGNYEEVIFVGPEFMKAIDASANVKKFNNSTEAFQYFKSQNYTGKNILLKGSRGIELEKILGV